MKLEITANGDTEDDLVIALREVISLVEHGFTRGFGLSETGSYDFLITPRQEATLSSTERYIAAACRKFQGDTDVSISLDAPVDTDTIGGAWVSALIFVADDELEPPPGPSYGVFRNKIRWGPTGPDWGGWTLDARFSCDDDSDGKRARAAAHQRARSLRATYPAALVAVRNLSATNWAPRTPRLPD